ncbi:hypothetical protein HYPSUDRAFT_208801 [Hypholoma sublateritium FD-334 SS-4]|uniref:Uncharacterized protein n=1 Tax=Hypholoma sublateritium (strain FD-334 SS-4) TaxID=945553 RepID=A0A0D2N564_HYPSF|nr:hypothetical protein HYPSUDRAFT_208801 [Hypholoma sublateritium FD-334 SS-4]
MAPRSEAPRSAESPAVYREPTTASPRRTRPPTEASDRRSAVGPPPREATATPFNFQVAEESRGQLEELNAVANQLFVTAAAAQGAEDQRELEFRSHEEHRDDIFLQNEETRTGEAHDRAAGI